MNRGLRGAALLPLAGALLVCVRPARAQRIDLYLDPDVPGFDTAAGVTVTSRLHPEYDFPGVHLDGVLLHANATESDGYDSNIAGRANADGGAVLQTQADISAVAEQSDASIGADLRLNDTEYPGFADQSTIDWQAQLGASRQIGRDTLSFGFTHLNLDQNWRDLDVPLLDHPIAYRIDDGRASYRAMFSRLSVTPTLDVAGYDFDNGSIAGTPYLQAYRDRVVTAPGVTLGYDLAPRRSLVLVVSDALASYRQSFPGLPVRDYNDISVLAGVSDDIDGVIRVRALAGYEARHFRSAQYSTIAAPIAEISASWTPTGLTTLTASASRSIQDAAAETTTGFTETATRLEIDHEYRRNVVLHAEAGFTNDLYPHGGGSQSYTTAGVGATWLLNRHLRLAATYAFAARSGATLTNDTQTLQPGTDIFGGAYREHRIVLQLTIGF